MNSPMTYSTGLSLTPNAPREGSRAEVWLAGGLLALMPAISFLAQYAASANVGTEELMFRHLTVTYVDWIFVAFNLLVVHVIDWKRGSAIFTATVVTMTLNTATHAFWQYHGIDGGHMISGAQIVLPAGWIHLVYSNLQMILLVAFVFIRRPNARFVGATSVLAAAYFLAAGLCGYLMSDGVMVSDAVMVASGLFFVCVFPSLRRFYRRPNKQVNP